MKVCGQIHTPTSLLSAKCLRVEQDGPQMRSGRFGEERNLSPLLQFEPQIIQPVAQSPHQLGFLVSEFKTGLGPYPIANVIFWAAACSLISDAFIFLPF
jgi:hypothetical protein